MKIKSALLGAAIGCGFFANLCTATTNSWTNADLPSGYWQTVAVSGNGNVLIAANGGGWSTPGQIYVSTNSGTTWTLTSAPNAIWTSVAACNDGHLLFAAAGGDSYYDYIYFSTNFGVDWMRSGSPTGHWGSIACSGDGIKLVAAAAGPCSYGPIYVSADAGVTWTATGAPVTSWWLVASSADGTKLAAASVLNGILISTNSGAVWRSSGLTNTWFESMAISADGQRLAAASMDGPLYISTDSGSTWTLITNVPGTTSAITASADGSELAVWSLLPGPYCQHVSGIYFSADEGTVWTTNQWPYVDIGWDATVLLACSANLSTVAVSLGYDGIYTWQAPPPSAPVAITWPATGTNGDFMLRGGVDPNRAETWSWFDWDTSSAFGNSTAPIFSGGAWGYVPFTSAFSAFPPGVAVYFRMAAANNLGFSLGQPLIYQAPLVTLLGDNPLYLVCGDFDIEPGATVKALPISIAAGSSYCLALKADRTVVSWGNTDVDPPGTSTTPPPISNVVAIAAGNIHGLALEDDGTIVGWGDNSYGELNLPTNLNRAVAVSAGYGFSLALKPDGTVVGWGLGSTNPTVYDGLNYGQAAVPEGLTNVVAIAAGFNSSLALKSDGTVVSWGFPLAVGTNPPANLSNVVAIAAGPAYGLALKNDGTVVGWEYDNGTNSIPPSGLSNVVAIAAGYYNNLALKGDGTVVGWGYPVGLNPPAGLSHVVAITAGSGFNQALKADGTVVGWRTYPHGKTVAPPDLVDSLGTATVIRPVNDWLPGTYTRTYSATNAQGTMGRVTRTVVVMDARETRQRILAQMMELNAAKPYLHQLDQVIATLNRALAPKLWVGDMYLTDKGGQDVFVEDMRVVLQLNQLLIQNNRAVTKQQVQGWEENLTKSARLLALWEFWTYDYWLIKAHQETYVANQLIQGDKAAAAHHYVNAILYYENAWKRVLQATRQHRGPYY